MAIIVEQKKRGGGLLSFFIVIVLFAGAAWFVYQLLFAPTVAVKPVYDQDQQIISGLSKISVDPASVVTSPELRLIKKQIPDVVTGQLGRKNPFLPF